jgi:hypothetical protein
MLGLSRLLAGVTRCGHTRQAQETAVQVLDAEKKGCENGGYRVYNKQYYYVMNLYTIGCVEIFGS